jgi:hypothetical protein
MRDEEGKVVEYKAVCGKAWCEAAQTKKAANDLTATGSATIAIILRGLPDPLAVLAFYEALAVAHFGSSFRDAKANVHKFGGVKQMGDLDSSITLHTSTMTTASTAFP